MTPENFCYWLQGFFEINGDAKPISQKQAEMIQEHLQLVFTKVTGDPSKGDSITSNDIPAKPPKDQQDIIHRIPLTKPPKKRKTILGERGYRRPFTVIC